MSADIQSLSFDIVVSSENATTGIDRLIASLSRLNSTSGKTDGLERFAKSLDSIEKKLSKNSTFQALFTTIEQLNDKIEKTSFGSLISETSELATAQERLNKAVERSTSSKVKATKTSEPKDTKKTASTSKLDKVMDGASATLTGITATLISVGTIVNKTKQYIGNAIDSMSSYTSAMNVFYSTMGRYAKEHEAFADLVSEKMFIDKAEWVDTQGLLMTTFDSFGIGADNAAKMSKNMTQLTYDMASFFHISNADAFAKIQSAIAGRGEGLKKLGYDVSQKKLGSMASELGISKNVTEMNQAELAMLRYNAILSQVTQAQGNFGRTMNSLPNLLSMAKSQVSQLGRTLGNVLLPALTTILPYIIAGVRLITEFLTKLGFVVGFEAPSIGLGVGDALVEDVTTGTEEAKKILQDFSMGFDELNVISPNKGSAGGGVGTGGNSVVGDIPILEYDFMDGILSTKIDAAMKKLKPFVDWLTKNFKAVAGIVTGIAAGMLAWKVSSTVLGFLKDFITVADIGKVSKGIGLVITGLVVSFASGYSIGYDGLTLTNAIGAALGTLAIGAGLVLLSGSPYGWVVGAVIGIVATIAGITIGKTTKSFDEDWAKRFGEITLNEVEIQQVVDVMFNAKVFGELELFIKERETLTNMIEGVAKATKAVDAMNHKISLGINISQSEYLEVVTDTITKGQEMLNQQKLVSTLAIATLHTDGSGKLTDIGASATAFAQKYYTETHDKLGELGNRLKDVVNTGFSNGEWIPDKLQQATSLSNEINTIIRIVENADYEARLEYLKMKLANVDIDSASYQKIQAEIEETTNTHLASLDGINIEEIKVANLMMSSPDAAVKKEGAALLASIEERVNKSITPMELDIITVNAAASGIRIGTSFENEMAITGRILESTVTNMVEGSFSQAYKDYEPKGDAETLIDGVTAAVTSGIALHMTPSSKKSAITMLEALGDTIGEHEVAASKARIAGEKIPEALLEGLNQEKGLQAIIGDTSAIQYMIGKEMSASPSFIEMLSTIEGSAQKIPTSMQEGLFNNTDVVIDAANGIVTFANDAIGTKTVELTPTMRDNMETMGYNIGTGLYAGAEKEVFAAETKWQTTFGKVGAYIKGIFTPEGKDIITEEMGKDLSKGLYNGANKELVDKKSDWQKTWKIVLDGIIVALGFGSPSKITHGYGINLSEGLINGTAEKLEADKGKWSTTWGKISGGFKTFFGIGNTKTSTFSGLGGNLATEGGAGFTGKISSFTEPFKKIGGLFKTHVIDPIKKMFGSVINWVADKTNPVIDSVNNMLNKLPQGIKDTFGISGNTISHIKKVDLFEKGGFPEKGNFFMAHEDGNPEFVGSMGSRTVVANNTQIVSGVAQGVAEANQESNNLMRQMIALLTDINNKDNSVVIGDEEIYKSSERGRSKQGVQMVTRTAGGV